MSSVEAGQACPHEDGIYCPNIEAPRVTELREGFVTVKYTVTLNGSTDRVSVVESQGDPRWIESVVKTIKTWRYQKPDKVYELEFQFKAKFSE